MIGQLNLCVRFKVLKAADGQKALDLLEVCRGALLQHRLQLHITVCLCWGARFCSSCRACCRCKSMLLHVLLACCGYSIYNLPAPATLHGPVMRANTEHLSLNQRRVRQPRPMRPRLHLPAISSDAHA